MWVRQVEMQVYEVMRRFVASRRCGTRPRVRAGEPGVEAGQTTAEYALVLLGAASVAVLLIAWVTHSGKIDDLFNTVFDQVIGKAKG